MFLLIKSLIISLEPNIPGVVTIQHVYALYICQFFFIGRKQKNYLYLLDLYWSSDVIGWQKVGPRWKIFLEIWNDKKDPDQTNLEPVIAVSNANNNI